MERAIVSFSGGADSTTLLYSMRSILKPENVLPMYFDYGQRHKTGELHAVHNICEALRIECVLMDAFNLTRFGRSPLTDLRMAVPRQVDGKQAETVVPYRNSFFILSAAAYAVTNGYDTICIGATKEDLAAYPDCRPAYFDAMQQLLRLGDRGHNLTIYTPWIEWTKAQVVHLGITTHEVPYSLTHTCYQGKYQDPCRVCDACKEREAGFRALNMQDPLYAKQDQIS